MKWKSLSHKFLQTMYCTYLGQWSNLLIENTFSSCLKQNISLFLNEQLCNVISLYKCLFVINTQAWMFLFATHSIPVHSSILIKFSLVEIKITFGIRVGEDDRQAFYCQRLIFSIAFHLARLFVHIIS